MIFHTLEFAEQGLSGSHAQNKSTLLTSSASREMVQPITSERKITMQISNIVIPEIILQKHVVISWCENMATCETNCFLFYKDADGCVNLRGKVS